VARPPVGQQPAEASTSLIALPGFNVDLVPLGKRLREVAANRGIDAYMIDNALELQQEWLTGKGRVGVTAGASAPECLVEEVVKFLATKDFNNVQELEVMPENVRFGLPPEIVEAIASAPASVSAD